MPYSRGIQAYRQTDLQSMGKEKLIVLLYRKILEHLDAAAVAAGAQDRAGMGSRLGRAQRIVTELRGALDHDVGGDIADNLAALYDFVFKEILQMLVDQDPVHVANARRVLEPLLEAWSSITPGSADLQTRAHPATGMEPASRAQNEQTESGAPAEPQRATLRSRQVLTSA